MNKLLKLSILLIFPFAISAQTLSENAKVYLVTCGAGDDLYSVFGHSALWIVDSEKRIDAVFNYGTFDFDGFGFYLKFARGKLDYLLSISDFRYFLAGYKYEERYVTTQLLNLTFEEKTELFAALRENYKPENRAYRYDFFYDNCSTRLRDLLADLLGDKLDYHLEMVKEEKKSFRDFIDDYTFNVPWGDFGIDLALGLPTDIIADPFHQMFLPEHLMDAFGRATVTDENGVRQLVVATEEVLDLPRRSPQWQWFTPLQVFWLLFFIVLLFTIRTWKKDSRRFDNILFGIIGFVGIMLVLLWFATDHTATAKNFNLLWALPTWWLIAFLPSKSLWRLRFLRLHFVLLLAMFVGWFFLPQALHPAILPIGLVLLMRLLKQYRMSAA
ncbi:MAG: DUF4105 domain-containing protein [Cryomorphaceae bacterium]|nr:DUF4105 domain-containing protein [Cryomorphaceae bacterium]